MSFRITGLAPEPFSELFTLTDAQLRLRNAQRLRAQPDGGYPCRISLCDALPDEELILTHYQHHDVSSPFSASDAIYIRDRQTRFERVYVVPEHLRKRLLSLRAFDADGMLVDADVIDGPALETLMQRLFAEQRTAYLHIHFAKAGCYAARAERA
jgi:hypothetical protein